MESLKCEKCGGKLKLEHSSCVCVDCGEAYSFFNEKEIGVAGVEIEQVENSEFSTEESVEIKTNEKKHNWVGWMLGLAIVGLLICAFVWGNGSEGRKISQERVIEEILSANGYSNLEIVAVEDLGGDIDGLIGNNKLVLIKKSTGEYGFGAINTDDKTFQDFEFGYAPLNILMLTVFSSGEQLNLENFRKAIEYVKRYGYYCLSNQEYAESYIREITGENGFLPCETGRRAIIDNITYILPDIKSLPQYEVIFEDGNANPMYYAGLSSEMKYMWDHIFPESTYKVWEASVDTQQKNIMKAIYGQPYSMQKVWAVVDKNLKEVGTYGSIESAKGALLKASTTKNSTDSKGDSTQKSKNNPTSAEVEHYKNPAVSNIDEKSENYQKKNEKEIIIGYTHYEPFAYKSNGILKGFDIDLAKEVCKILGLSPVFVEINWDNRVSLLNSGKIDCLWNGLIKTDKVMSSMDVSNAYLTSIINYEDSVETEDIVIGFKKGSGLVDEFNSALFKVKENGFVDNLKTKYNVG